MPTTSHHYSNLATSESDISAVTTMSEETRSKLRSGCLSGRSLDTVQRYSEGVIRRPSQRRASIHAKANIRDQLISDQDKKDASYNGGKPGKIPPRFLPLSLLTLAHRWVVEDGRGRSSPPTSLSLQDRSFTSTGTTSWMTW